MPSTWTTKEKKSLVWVTRVNPGAHPLDKGMPLVLVLREILGYANTSREAKQILNNKEILIDGVRRKDHRFNIGLMDSIAIPEIKENYRISLGANKRLKLVKIDAKEAKLKLCKIKGKGLCKGKIELRLSDGRTILHDKKEVYKTGDSVVIEVPEQKIVEHIKFEKGCHVLIINGKNTGSIGIVEEIKENNVKIKSKNNEFETLKKYCLVIGKGGSALKLE